MVTKQNVSILQQLFSFYSVVLLLLYEFITQEPKCFSSVDNSHILLLLLLWRNSPPALWGIQACEHCWQPGEVMVEDFLVIFAEF
jgi:hypothetical protein